MKVLIVGASGLVGSHLMKVFDVSNNIVVGTHLNYPTLNTVFYDPSVRHENNFYLGGFNPDIVIHCGALTNVDYCENNEFESERATVWSTKCLADYCKANKAKLIYISSDYVFDGKNGPYKEDANVNPINVYGRHKLEAENLVRQVNNHLVLRITNVYGEEERLKNFISRLISMFENDEKKVLKLPVDQFATPIYAGDVARMAGILVENSKKGLYHLSTTDFFSRYHLAKKIESYFPNNSKIKLEPILTENLKQLALRPLYGGLLNFKFLSEFNDFRLTNIDDYVLKVIKNEI